MRGIKMESPAKSIFEWIASIYEWVYLFSIYVMEFQRSLVRKVTI